MEDSNTVNLLGSLFSVTGFFVGLYTLWKVQKVSKVQQEERRITQELLDVDQIELDIRRVINKLFELSDADSMTLANDLSLRLGAIQGTRKAMDKNVRKVLNGATVAIESGFFSSNHIDQLIEKSISHIDIMTGSTRLISSFYTMDKIRQACERGVHVRIIGIDPEAPDDILIDAARTVTNPAPTTPNEYRELMREIHQTIKGNVGKWENKKAKERFKYRSHSGVPRVSIARSDDLIDLGFLQLLRAAQPNKINDRQYIQIQYGCALGDVVSKHFEICWNEGKQIMPEIECSRAERD